MVNALVLTLYKKKKYVAFVDQIVRSFLLDRNENPELHNLVKLYQLHRHSRTYRKYENEACRFKFAKFFSKEALIVFLFATNMPEGIKMLDLRKKMKCFLKSKTMQTISLIH